MVTYMFIYLVLLNWVNTKVKEHYRHWKKIIIIGLGVGGYVTTTFNCNISSFYVIYVPDHGLKTPLEEIAFNPRPKIYFHSQIFRYNRSMFGLPYRPKYSDFFDLCLHWVSVVRDADNSVTGISSLIGPIHTRRQQKRWWEGSKFHQTLRTVSSGHILWASYYWYSSYFTYVLLGKFSLFSNFMYCTI